MAKNCPKSISHILERAFTARDMRLKYKSQLSAIEKRRAKGTKVDEPVHVNLYVSDTLPNWQQTAIDVIKSNLGPNGEWPEMKVISTALSPKQKPELKIREKDDAFCCHAER